MIFLHHFRRTVWALTLAAAGCSTSVPDGSIADETSEGGDPKGGPGRRLDSGTTSMPGSNAPGSMADAAAGPGGSGGAGRLDGSATTGDDAPAPGTDASTVPDAMRTCDPEAGGPYWLEEGASVSATVKCATGLAASGRAFTLAGLPAGATYDPVTAKVAWKPGLDQAGVYAITITAMGETGTLKIGVADKFDDAANVGLKDVLKYTEEFGLPVFHLKTTPALANSLAEEQRRTSAIWANPCKPICGPSLYSPVTVTYRGRTYQAEIKYRGAWSLNYPKKNYTLRFSKEDRFNEPLLTGGRMVNRRRLALITTFDDNAYLRWRMAFETWNRMSPKTMRIEHFSAVVYVDGKYVGLYAVSDKIDSNVAQRAGLSESGNLYMGVDHTAGFEPMVYGSSVLRARRCPFEGFSKKDGLPDECNNNTFVPGAYDDLVPFVDFVAKSDEATFRSGIGQLIDVPDYINWFIHASATLSGDTYAKNAVHYHDPAGGPWRVVGWDYNESFGQTSSTKRQPTTTSPDTIANYTVPPVARDPISNYLWRRLWNHPTHGPAMRARYAAVLKNELKLETVLTAFDAMAKEIDASARRDERKWGASYKSYYGAVRSDFNSYSQEVAFTRQWIVSRWKYLQTLYP